MAFSTQRLLVMIIAINLIISLSFAIYETPSYTETTAFWNQIDGTFGETVGLGDYAADRSETEAGAVAPEGSQEISGFGSAIRMGTTVMGLLVRGLVALPFTTTVEFSDPIMRIAGFGLITLWSLMYMLIALEVFMLFVSGGKKT